MLKNLQGSSIGTMVGQVGDLGKQIGIGVVKAGKDIVKTAPQQVAGGERAEVEKKKEAGSGGLPETQSFQKQDANTKDLLKAMYEPSEQSKDSKKTSIAEKHPEKTPEEIQKMTSLVQQLHKESYYDPTFNPQKKLAEEKAQEEQKEQEEEAKKRWELQEKEQKKKEESAVLQKQRSIETRVGAG